ncbi:MAG: hypothetical protein JWO05_2113 [Gemmatimonadetes bacterium]|nr:hypothetical protein [Gemmatimonadota bacterium]
MIASRLVGYALFVSGGLLATFAGGRYAVGGWRRAEAFRSWNENAAREEVAFALRAANQPHAALPVVEGSPVARLAIPRIGLDEIVLEGVNDDELNAAPGHFPGSAFPGENGNAIVSAHRDRQFDRLDELAVGDTIHTESGAMNTRWIVIARRVVDKDARALFRTKDATLTLTTCWPIRYLGSAPERLIVVAKKG